MKEDIKISLLMMGLWILITTILGLFCFATVLAVNIFGFKGGLLIMPLFCLLFISGFNE